MRRSPLPLLSPVRTPKPAPLPRTLRRGDYLLLAGFCLLLFGFTLGYGRSFSTHETIHCVNVREMIADGDWIIPHFGGRPWLERPPLPFWITVPLVRVLGDIPAVYRLAPMLAAVPCVLLAGWMASVWFGRAAGLLTGLSLATVREFAHYASAPECDIFLCGVITTAVALFVALEFRRRPADGEGGFVGRRPWPLLAFFAVLGLTNLAKGLFFGTVLTLVPVAGYLLLGPRPWSLVRRYVWLPGWLAFAATASAWAVAAYCRYPDVTELWKSDYAGRMNTEYMREPAWYYLANLPWVLFPWTFAALLGVGVSWGRIFRAGRTPERFLFVWGVGAVAVLSVAQGKHHHYLLHSLAPWAAFAALGTVRVWRWLRESSPTWLVWGFFALLAVCGEAGLAFASARHAAPDAMLYAAMAAWPVVLLCLAWIASQREPWRAGVALFSLLLVGQWFEHAFPTLRDDRYAGDREFAARVRETVPAEESLFVMEDYGPLDQSWMDFYLDGRARLLHNASFIRVEPATGPEVYVIGRREFGPTLDAYGTREVVLESGRSRESARDGQRFCLYRVQLRADLERHPGPVYISPMQATGRAPGPVLTPRGADELSWNRP
jgi:4-amino-4-deoxy-L-arabinose transferase-like glycosyltransferase